VVLLILCLSAWFCTWFVVSLVIVHLTLQGAEELDIGGGSRMRAQVEVAQMKEQLESQVWGRQISMFA